MHSITVETNYQPLTSIWKKTIATSSPRLQRLLLRLAQNNVNIQYLRGKENIIADVFSRVVPLKPEFQDYNTRPTNIEKVPVHLITKKTPASSLRLQDLCEATKDDPTLQLLITQFEKIQKPITSSHQTAKINDKRQMMQSMKQQQANYYNKSAKDLPQLNTGQTVYVQLKPNVRNWTLGIIVRTGLENSRTYSVKTIQGGVYALNRKFFRTRYVDAPYQIKQTAQATPIFPKKPKPQRLIETVGQIRQTQYSLLHF